MSMGPKELTGRPETADGHATDVLADVLDAMRLSTLIYGRLELYAPWGLQFPDTEAAQIVVAVRGSALLSVEGASTLLTLSAGDLALLPHGGGYSVRDAEGSPVRSLEAGSCHRARALGTPIRMGGDGPQTTLVTGAFQFGVPPRSLLFEKLPRVIHVAAGSPQASPSLASALQLLIAESTSTRPGATVVMSRLADILLVQAIRTYIEEGGCQKHGLCALADPPIAKALALIHERPAEPWTVESLAAAVALSRSGFAARFSAQVGDPPLEYLARWRMTKAAQLLRESTLSLSEVAGHTGYQSEASFNRAFKRWEGIAPGAYRRERRTGPAPAASAGG
ncbi:AraC family transcriptional regulator [Stigmatella erecta]|uniref:AraC-type DNA-binding protein n=1 Tax=Stigmatella erecta TaxID=83460 RepID=A0A1I0LFZ9_9BACT|nr:AraC family transcriptional regulator [Stigmatella erecta]SEU39023.1 AraC-type DNA-binding protein [Stigmatella erecta]